jgi:hypothetical protein
LGKGKLFINGNQVDEAEIEHTVPLNFGLNESLTCGYDNDLYGGGACDNRARFA